MNCPARGQLRQHNLFLNNLYTHIFIEICQFAFFPMWNHMKTAIFIVLNYL